MSSKEKREEHEQSTQAIAQQPQEEFISPQGQPSKDESEVAKPSPGKDREPGRPER